MTTPMSCSMRSKNKKTGPLIATYRTFDTCPQDCPFAPWNTGGCYAQGRIESLPRRFGKPWKHVLKDIEQRAPRGQVIRHHVVGDVMQSGEPDWDYIDALNELHERRPDLQPILYTHAWRELGPNPFTFPVNASCETTTDLEEALDLGYDAVVVVENEDDPLLGSRFEGRHVVQCPYETHGVTCADCRLCAKGQRGSIVAFVPHGVRKHDAEEAVQTRKEGP